MSERDMRNGFIDCVRGLSILIVVFGHAIQKCNGMDPTTMVQKVVMTFWMPIFFMISGYLCSMSKNRDYIYAVRKKVQRLLIPYVLWEQVHFLVNACMGGNYSMWRQFTSILDSGFWFLRIL